tara:strand:+ start:196 stop:921 length:726 start_codon:yes stop_codon:yes gene_type:complete
MKSSDYFGRAAYFDEIADYGALLTRCNYHESHTIDNTKLFVDLFNNSNCGNKALSVGCDPFKEWTLLNSKMFNEITVYDIDKEFVDCSNIFWKKHGKKIHYYNQNIIDISKLPKDKFSTLLLFQMDYIFNDKEYGHILNLAKTAGITECYVITPSLFHLRVSEVKKLYITLFDFVHLVLYLIKSLMKTLFQKSDNRDGYWSYKRSVDHFIRVFKESSFKKDREHSILNRNGSFHFFRFEIE